MVGQSDAVFLDATASNGHGFAAENRASVLERIGSHLFFTLFVAQILSPYIWGVTIYLEVILALLNPFFLGWVAKKQFDSRAYWLLFGILGVGVFAGVAVAVKFVVVVLSVMFLHYAYERRIFYLGWYLGASILVAVVQFASLILEPTIARTIGPSNIAQSIWGAYATPTFTNFYAVFLVDRVSGLSREAGFLASLVVGAILLVYLEAKRFGHAVSGVYKAVLFAGWILSLSKMSFILLPVLMLEKVSKLINLVPRFLAVVFFVALFMVFWNFNSEYLLNPTNDSFLHRFGAYMALQSIDSEQLFLGVHSLEDVDSIYASLLSLGFDSFTGFAGFVFHYGILAVTVFFVALIFSGVSTTGLLILLLLTVNVELDTNQNFVILAYFIAFKFYSSCKVVRFM